MVRLKNRYLLVNILYPELEKGPQNSKVPVIVAFHQPTTDEFDVHTLLKGLRAAISNLFGDFGSGAVSDSLSVKYLSPATSTFILRVARSHYRLVWVALSLMNSVPVKNGKNCVFQVVRVSGTIKKAEEEAIRRAKEMIIKGRSELGEQCDSTLDTMFGKMESRAAEKITREVCMVDRSDIEDDDELDNSTDG